MLSQMILVISSPKTSTTVPALIFWDIFVVLYVVATAIKSTETKIKLNLTNSYQIKIPNEFLG